MSDPDTTSAQEPPKQRREFIMPPLRLFEVLRFKPKVISDTEMPELEVLQISAHIVQHTGKGRVLLFLDYIVDPVVGPTTRLHRMLPSYEDLKEVNVQPSTTQESVLIH